MFEWFTVSQSMILAAIMVPLAGFTLSGDLASGPSPCTGENAPIRTHTSAETEDAAVRVALNAYLEGHRTGQADAFRRAFHPDARMLYVRDGQFVKTEIAEYIARAPGKPAADEDQRRRRIDSIDIVGDAAIAKITLDYPEVTFTDYMTLLKVDGEWRIVSKVFNADRSKTTKAKDSKS
jgi:Putative lumazine-binding